MPIAWQPYAPDWPKRWEQAENDKKTWIFHLRRGVKFHDGTDFNADAVIWNFDRYFKKDSPQFEAGASGITRSRVPLLASYKKIDDYTVALTTTAVASYFPSTVIYVLFTSPASFEKAGNDWARVATLPAAGTGPFRITQVTPRQSVRLARWDGYWDAGRKAKVDSVLLLPIPEANTRLAALRSGQVDWIEVPPPDGVPSLKAAGFTISTNSYPHVWPWMYNIGAANSPFKDVRVRQALNYCVDRSAIVSLLNGTAEPAVGWLKPNDPAFGNPVNRYGFDPAKGKALLAEAGYTAGEAALVQGDDLEFRLRPDAAAADERAAAAKPETGLRRGGDLRCRRVAGAVEFGPSRPRQSGAEGRDGGQSQLAHNRHLRDGALFRGGQCLAGGLEFLAMEGRRIRSRAQCGDAGDGQGNDRGVLPDRPRTSAGQSAVALRRP